MSWFRKERTYTLLFEFETSFGVIRDTPRASFLPSGFYPTIDSCIVHDAKELPRVGDTLVIQLPARDIEVMKNGNTTTKEAQFAEFKFLVTDVERKYHWIADVIVGDRLLKETPGNRHVIKLLMTGQGREL